MSAWKPIPKNLKIPHNDMVIVRKPNQKTGGWNIELAYKSVGNGWRVENGASGIHNFTEYCKIPV